METTTILGIDLASQAKNTAACILICEPNGAVTIEPARLGLADEGGLHELTERADAIGIDAPLGWPEPFREAVARGFVEAWDDSTSKAMRMRATDLFVQNRIKSWPLSVSTDRIALAAMRAMALLHKFGVREKSGAAPTRGRNFFEVYPAASLQLWKIDRAGYKAESEAALETRRSMLKKIQEQIAPVSIPPEYAASDHVLDALIAALTAYAASVGKTIRPDDKHQALAATEGWIHLPSVSLGELF